MKVIDLINNSKKTAFSFEILPPLKGTGIEKLYQTVDTLREFAPKYINITTHRSEYVYKDLGNGLFQRNRLRRRPGTVAVAAAIQNKYNITVVPHILCSGFTREETEYVLLDLQFLNITDLLVQNMPCRNYFMIIRNISNLWNRQRRRVSTSLSFRESNLSKNYPN